MISIANGDLDPGYITINTNALRVASKISRKVYIPQDNKFNYIGLIIGPKGANQKQLEEDTNCKILIRYNQLSIPFHYSSVFCNLSEGEARRSQD